MPQLMIAKDDGTVVATRAFPALFGQMLLDRYGGEPTDPLADRLGRVLDSILRRIGQGAHRDSFGTEYADWLLAKKGKTQQEGAALGFTAVETLPDKA